MIKLSWVEFKSFISDRAVPISETTIGSDYYLEAHDGQVSRECLLNEAVDKTDYITNYQAGANTSVTDSDGTPLQRTKITKTGWHYQCNAVEWETSKLSSIYNSDKTDTDLGATTIKYYNSLDVELTAGTQSELDSNCVKTVITFEPSHDMEVIGGIIFQAAAPTVDVRLWVTAVPDLTVAQGGSVPFCQGGINLKHVGIGNVYNVDGKTPKMMPYNSTYHTNKFEIVCAHPAGHTHEMMMVFQIFRENV